ncbi:transcription elongation factor GreA [Paenibacillus lignilyticus]|uniref:Transcription elongation factor GreA n=1 Tax=Paenibacillus lignilyticus TaxID=1172615 RepID=A0ABS5CGG4_9BACL|nr:transcription elongation factor GreA [Paenibacillus lignilyticus]MBP3964983.1 transcription elongation factor GreA [Paenibacillus lignilyticus]
MSNEEMILTKEGFAKLQEELDDLKYVKRKELAERIKLAISYGDLKENSEYHSAKNDQSFLETRVIILEKMLNTARIVETDPNNTSSVQIGSSVILNDVEFDERIEYQIVAPAEADVQANKISYESPLGKELLGKTVGSRINVNAPMGVIVYELLEVRAL